MIDFYPGQQLELRAAATNPATFNPEDPENPAGILFFPGTRVKVSAVGNNQIEITFPTNEIFIHDPITVLTYFNIIENDKPIYTKRTVKVGILDNNLGDYLPVEATWKKKYKTTIIIQIEELGDRGLICCYCASDLDENLPKDENGLVTCQKCGQSISPMNASDFYKE